MRIIRRVDKLIIGRKDFLYALITICLIFIALNIFYFHPDDSSKFILLCGIPIIIALFVPIKNIVLDYKKKELISVHSSIIPVFKEKHVVHIKNIVKLYPEVNLKQTFSSYRNQLMLLETNNATTVLLKLPSDSGTFYLWNYKRIEQIANVLNEKIHELKRPQNK